MGHDGWWQEGRKKYAPKYALGREERKTGQKEGAVAAECAPQEECKEVTIHQLLAGALSRRLKN